MLRFFSSTATAAREAGPDAGTVNVCTRSRGGGLFSSMAARHSAASDASQARPESQFSFRTIDNIAPPCADGARMLGERPDMGAFEELSWRGLVQQTTAENIAEVLATPLTVYSAPTRPRPACTRGTWCR